MKFTRIRIHGFKSFVEATELHIEPGLSGIVGPNGCGKSNLVEALRWVMGESSYKSMRASGMEDVIFSGSANRPARNSAEVTIMVDNSERKAPAAFNDSDLLEVTRRIERDAGSVYRINGKEVRLRDVQLLFADASTGARSPALVRQGQIGELVDARPEARRRLLEEAAGISGLHSRRHEAELRLHAAETNLERLSDVIAQIETQLSGLKRQARQAARYKKVAAEIRKSQALLLAIKWAGARRTVGDAEAGLAEETGRVNACTARAAAAATERTAIAADLPPLRETEARAAAALQRLTLAQAGLEQELERANRRMEEIQARIAQLQQDLARESAMVGESGEADALLEAEQAELAREIDGADAAEEAARSALDEAAGALKESEQALSLLLDELAQLRARRNQLEGALADNDQRLTRLHRQLADVEIEFAELRAGGQGSGEVVRFTDAVDQAGKAIGRAEQEQLAAERALAAAREQEARLREPLIAAEREAERLNAEVATLAKVLNVAASELWPPLIDAVEVDKGYEAALGAAFGDDLEAPEDAAAPAHWQSVAPTADDPALPPGVMPLAAKVRAPGVLARRLAQAGIVAPDDGEKLQRVLRPGQRLVSVKGDLWRWDGYSASAEAATGAQRLEQRRRLAELQAEAEGARANAASARDAIEAGSSAVREAALAEETSRNAWREAQSILSQARDRLAQAERQASQDTVRLSALSEARARLKASIEETEASRGEAEAALAALGSGEAQETELDALRAKVAAERAVFAAAQARFDGLKREAELRVRRLEAMGREREMLAKRRASAAAQIEVLEARQAEARGELETLEGAPAEIEASRRRLMSEIADAEKARAKAADAVVAAESKLGEADKAGRAADEALAVAREARARTESRLEAGRQRLIELAAEIEDQIGMAPQGLPAATGLGEGDPLPGAEETEARLERLMAERERLGAVNLRAEEEAAEVEEQLNGLIAEREDLEQALRRLRHGIGQLNREGRERLLAAFETVNSHFQQLFTTLFNGGMASLDLTDSDDPLEAGLEIMARPPGKRLQVLSLLSGGEQALTALALIFAVFLTNPAPICVLDEVDAPLDDANVERFCTLVEQMVTTTDTRFVVITHHPLTMSRMDRLFGVTMAERGVSQLVSVDLETAASYRQAS
ncbi:MAG: chromosome segregation protein SMC [Hyphomicrobiales bacterium]|nr:chromosome segregation protein SMC [Hyphomicrobiales bacterium]